MELMYVRKDINPVSIYEEQDLHLHIHNTKISIKLQQSK